VALRTLVVVCPDWAAMAAGIPAAEPAAVVRANQVVACTTAARAEGVRPGLRRREAQGRCPGLALVEHDPARDAREFAPVVAAVEALTPRVEVVRPGVCAFGSRGASRQHGGDEPLARLVAGAVDEALGARGRCLVGVADGLFAAGLAARRASRGRRVLVVPPGDSQAFLAPVPVDVLDRPDLADLLTRLGVRTLGALAALPASAVGTRFGPEGVRAHRLARGLDEHPPAPRQPPPDLAVTAEVDPPAERADVVAFTAKSLADALHQRLAQRGLACTRVRIEAETEHGEHLARAWRSDLAGSAGGVFGAAAIAERVRWQLDGWLNGAVGGRPSAGVSLLRLVPEEVTGERGRQLGFWGGEREADVRAARSLARVQGMLGHEAVVIPFLRGGRDPADRVTHVPHGGQPAAPAPVALATRRVKAARRPPSSGAMPAWHPSFGVDAPTPPAGPGAPVSFLGGGGAAGAGATVARHPSLGGGAPPGATSSPPAAGQGAPVASIGGGTPSGATSTPPAARATVSSLGGGGAPWPGRVPAPAPATVHARPLTAEVLDDEGGVVAVTGRGLPGTAPARLWVAGGPWATIAGWAGPWPLDERWWDPAHHRRRERFQVVTLEGAAYLLAFVDGEWWVEATYD
jgi:protein ImuB